MRNAGFTLLFLAATAAAASACDTNYATGYGPFYSFDYDSSAPTWNVDIYGGHVAYDLIAGTFGATGGGGGGKYSGGVQFRFSDAYQIVGPPQATPIPFQVVIHFTGTLEASMETYPYIGTVCNAGSARLTCTSGAASVSTSQLVDANCQTTVFDKVMTLDLAKLPGETFKLSWELSAFGSRTGTNSGSFSFTGLPAGYSISWCQGYWGAPAPAAARSWGNLKAAYR